MDLFKSLLGPRADEPQEWTCEPLVAVADGGDILFTGRAVVEFVPNPGEPKTGRAAVLSQDGRGRVADLEVIDVLPRPVTSDPDMQKKNGRIVVGNTADGTPVTWYLGAAGDDVLLNGLPE